MKKTLILFILSNLLVASQNNCFYDKNTKLYNCKLKNLKRKAPIKRYLYVYSYGSKDDKIEYKTTEECLKAKIKEERYNLRSDGWTFKCKVN